MPLHLNRNPDRRTHVVSMAAAAAIVIAAMVGAAGCDESSSGSSTPTVTADNYVIVEGERGTPVEIGNSRIIDVTARMGMTTSINKIDGLVLTDTSPAEVLSGRQTFKSAGFTKSRPLRVENFSEPDGSKMVQVDVSLASPFALKSLTAEERKQFVPGPLLQDTIGNSYWPSGFILRTTEGEKSTLFDLRRGAPIKNLNDLPRLSRNKPQELILLFYVNKGVTLESLSYGGQQPKFTFQVEVEDR